MTEATLFLPGLSPVGGKTITATFDGGKLSSNGGVLILREIEKKLGLATVLSRHIPDDRDRMRITHSYSDMTRARMLAIASGHEDCDDLDVLRSDPALKDGLWTPAGVGHRLDVATDALAPGERPVLAPACAHGA
jgi:Transposase DDE domain group 1